MGSSSSSRSGSENRTAAKATRIRQPPENAEQGCSCSLWVNPRPRRIDAARASADHASMSTRRVCTSAMRLGSVAVSASASSASRSTSARSTVLISDTSLPGTSWDTPPIFQPLGMFTTPVSSTISPRMILNSVVLPDPLRPTSPTL